MAQARQVSQEAIAIARATGDKEILGYGLEYYSYATNYSGGSGGEAAAQEGLEIFSNEVNDNFGLSLAYMSLGINAARKGDELEKQKYFGKLKETIGKESASFQAGFFLISIGMTESSQGNYQAAQQIFDEGRYIFDRIHDATLQQVLQSELGHLARHTGRLPEAKAIYRKTIRSWQESGNRGAIANQLECFGFLASADKEPQRAIKLFSAAEALRKKAGSPRTNQEQAEFDQSLAQLRGMLNEAEFKPLWEQAERLSVEQAIQFAVAG